MIRGWWVGHAELGGVFVRAVTRGRAQALGASELDQDFTGVTAIRVSALDGTGLEGVLDWEEGKRLGAVWACRRCGEEYARTRRWVRSELCGECEEVERVARGG